jgi:hypothetical protein
MHFALAGCPIHAAQMHGSWPLIIALADTSAMSPGYMARLSAGGARQEKVRFLTQSFSNAT